MHESDSNVFDIPSLARQKRIANMVRAAISDGSATVHRITGVQAIMAIAAMLIVFASGHAFGEVFRPLSYSEKMVVEALIQHTAKQQKKPAPEITRHLLAELDTYKVKDIKSHQLNQALAVLGRYID